MTKFPSRLLVCQQLRFALYWNKKPGNTLAQLQPAKTTCIQCPLKPHLSKHFPLVFPPSAVAQPSPIFTHTDTLFCQKRTLNFAAISLMNFDATAGWLYFVVLAALPGGIVFFYTAYSLDLCGYIYPVYMYIYKLEWRSQLATGAGMCQRHSTLRGQCSHYDYVALYIQRVLFAYCIHCWSKLG